MTLAASNGFNTETLKQLTAQGYASNGTGPVAYPNNFSTSAGMTSNLDDMLKYAVALDGNQLLTDQMKLEVYSQMISNDGRALPYGLGWFIQEMEGMQIYWHYGYWIGMSSLIIRVPAKNLSFILMANSDMLSAPYSLGNGDVWVSPYAREFLKGWVLAGRRL